MPDEKTRSKKRRASGASLPFAGAGARLPFPVVGVGASAGGLEACTALLKALPANSGMAMVVIQHLDPHHQSLLHELLAKATRMEVAQVENGTALEPDHVYVIPPGKDLTVRQGALRLSSRQETGGKHMPVDRFLGSLAEDQNAGATGVILSGTGTDGTAGLEAIKAHGGITLAQEPATAQYSGMPESAIAAGCVDFVLPPEGIAQELARLASTPRAQIDGAGTDAAAEPPEDFSRIFEALRTATGIDFDLYKRGTVHRRIGRRMRLHGMTSMEQYAAYVHQHPSEAQTLGQDILIHVTRFFREPEAFRVLQRVVFPKLLAQKTEGDPVRIWVPGCSTGEEAYSVTIAFLEFLANRTDESRCQVFATDVSAAAIEKARSGIYSGAALAHVSAQRLRRFFVKVGDCYQVSKAVRDRCVFARHDLASDPPFARLDLISCRNVLIYLGPVLQKRVLSVFHYALRPHGFLMLGPAEALGSSAHLFAVEERRHKIYSRGPASPAPPPPLTRVARGGASQSAIKDAGAVSDLQKAIEAVVWRRRSLAALVVDSGLNVIHFQGDTGPYLGPPPGAASLHLFKLVRAELVLDLRTALHRAGKEQTPVRREGIRLAYEGSFKAVDIEVMPVTGRATDRPDFLVLIEASRAANTAQSRQQSHDLASLQHEVASTRQQLQSIIEGQEATNEELETAKEELQSSNEELTTLNDELQNRNAELGQLADDLSNLLVGVNIPVVILGADRRIRRFTPAAEPLLNLISTDVGRPISDIKPNIRGVDFDRLITEVVEDLRPIERDVQGQDGRWYSLRMRPYHGAGNKAEGVLLALMDIDVIKRGFDQVRLSRDEAVAERDLSAMLLDASGAHVMVRDARGAIIGFNMVCQRTSGRSFEEVKNKRLWDFLLAPEDVEPAKAAFTTLLEGVATIANYESSWIGKNGSRHVIAWSSLAHRAADGAVTRVISTGIDITQRKLTEDALRQSQEELRRLTANLFTTQEEERKRLARELHDDVNQRMAMLSNEVNMLERSLPASDETVRAQLRRLCESVDRLSDDLRRAAQQLHPSALEHLGLVAALESYCPDFSKLYSIRLEFTHRSVPDSIPMEVALCLYRVAQECLHNVAKHSGAREATLALRGSKGGLVLSVIDKGKGFDPAMPGRTGLGIVGIRERVRLVGGTVTIGSRPGQGTRVDVRVPLQRTAS